MLYLTINSKYEYCVVTHHSSDANVLTGGTTMAVIILLLNEHTAQCTKINERIQGIRRHRIASVYFAKKEKKKGVNISIKTSFRQK